MPKKFIKLPVLLLTLTLLVGGCSWPSSWPWQKAAPSAPTQENNPGSLSGVAETPVYTNDLKKFDSADELARFLADHNNSEGELSFDAKVPEAALSGALVPTLAQGDLVGNYLAAPDNLASSSQSVDIIKAGFNYTYALAKNELVIIKNSPAADASIISRIVFKSRPSGLLSAGNFIAIFGRDTQISNQDFYQNFRRQNPYTFFKVFDLSDPASPQLVRDLSFEGTYQAARLVGDYIYFLTDTKGNYIAGEPLTPRVVDSGQVLPARCDGAAKCFAPEVYYFDSAYNNYQFANLAIVNLQNSSEPLSGQTYLLNSGQNLYLSSNNLYISSLLAVDNYSLERQAGRELVYPKLSAADQDKINKIEANPGFVLNNSEKKIKIAQLIDSYLESLTVSDQAALNSEIEKNFQQKLSDQLKIASQTWLYKFALNGNKIEYHSKGAISGQLLNQFSLDESGDYLRVATLNVNQLAASDGTATDFYSSIYVLDNDLKTVGSLENLATTEKIADVRFIGNRVYLASLKTADPMFVISLADPTKPAVLGALRISGPANYLYPADPNGNKLISLGYELEGNSSTSLKVKGLKLSLFDFSDLAKPKELDNYLIGDATSDSLALSDHQSFSFSAAKNLLSFPTILHDSKGRLSFAGSLVFSLDNSRLHLKGRVDHSAGGHFGQLDSWGGFDYYDNTVKRGLYLDDNFLSFSNKFIKINSLASLAEVKSLALTTRGDDYLMAVPAVPTTSPATLPAAATSTSTSTSTSTHATSSQP